MKIGIITFHRAFSFGAQMQKFALYSYLKNMGHNVCILDYHCKWVEDCYISRNSYIWNDLTVMQKIKSKLIDLYEFINGYNKFRDYKIRKYSEFQNLYFSYTTRFNNPNDMPVDFDILITGSDQVWNSFITHGICKPYFLDNDSCDEFPAKKIAYAPSSEKNNYSTLLENRVYINKALSKFAKISVREKSLARFLNEKFEISADTVLDPTFLLTREDYLKIAEKPRLKRYVCTYCVSGSELPEKIADIIAKEKGIDVVHINACKLAFDNETSYGPQEVLGLLCYAEVIVTSSFHGTTFAIINRKDFYTAYENKSVRVQDLLEDLNINGRQLNSVKDYKFFEPTVYDEDLLSQKISFSKQWLNDSLISK